MIKHNKKGTNPVVFFWRNWICLLLSIPQSHSHKLWAIIKQNCRKNLCIFDYCTLLHQIKFSGPFTILWSFFFLNFRKLIVRTFIFKLLTKAALVFFKWFFALSCYLTCKLKRFTINTWKQSTVNTAFFFLCHLINIYQRARFREKNSCNSDGNRFRVHPA